MSNAKDLIEEIDSISKQIAEQYRELRIIDTKSKGGLYRGRKIGKESWWKRLFRK